MKKNFTFNLDSKYGDFLKIVKKNHKRSINAEVEIALEVFCFKEFGVCVSEFVREELETEELNQLFCSDDSLL